MVGAFHAEEGGQVRGEPIIAISGKATISASALTDFNPNNDPLPVSLQVADYAVDLPHSDARQI
jgi:hypothetical protein